MKTTSVTKDTLRLFVLIEMTIGWVNLTQSWLDHAKTRGY